MLPKLQTRKTPDQPYSLRALKPSPEAPWLPVPHLGAAGVDYSGLRPSPFGSPPAAAMLGAKPLARTFESTGWRRRKLACVTGSVALYSAFSGGGGWIRTTEAFASDLQSDPFGHSGTPPEGGTLSRGGRGLSTGFDGQNGRAGVPAARQPGNPPECGAGERNRTPDRLITNQLLYLLSYASRTRAR